MQTHDKSDRAIRGAWSRLGTFIAAALFSFLAIFIGCLAGRAAGLRPDDPQYFGIGASIALAFACVVIVVQNKRLRRARRALAEPRAAQDRLSEARRESTDNDTFIPDTGEVTLAPAQQAAPHDVTSPSH